MVKWINFLHIYQPPYQDKEVLRVVVRESYERVLAGLEANPKAKITLNIQGCLAQQLLENNFLAILDRIKNLSEKGQIELVSSAKFHPILPLIPEKEAVRQIELNNKINREIFGKTYDPTGFFMPEMAYSAEAAKIIYEQGFRWIILDEISLEGGKKKQENDKKYLINNAGLQVIFRNRKISKSYVPASILELLKTGANKNQTVITATDGELYGHHEKDREKIFEKTLSLPEIEMKTVSEYLNELEKIELVELVPSSWESLPEELKKSIPYFLWNNPENPIHQKIWQIAKIAINSIEKHQDDPNLIWAQQHLDHGLASCTFWWASSKKFNEMSMESWNPEEVGKGLNQLLKTTRALKNLDKETKIEAEYLAAEAQKDIWQTHWKRIKN